MAAELKRAKRAILKAQQIVNSLKVDAENDVMVGVRWGERALERVSQTLLEVDNELRAALDALAAPPQQSPAATPERKEGGNQP